MQRRSIPGLPCALLRGFFLPDISPWSCPSCRSESALPDLQQGQDQGTLSRRPLSGNMSRLTSCYNSAAASSLTLAFSIVLEMKWLDIVVSV